MSAAFLPFLKKQPVPAAKPAKDQEEEDPLALPLPQTKTSSQIGTANSKFISKLNGKSAAAKPGASHAGVKTTLTPSKSSSTPGTTKLGAAAGLGAAHRTVAASKALAVKAVPGKPIAGKGPAVGKPVPLTPAQAKAEAEKRRLKQLERLAALGALAPKDAPPELLAKYEQAKQQIAEIKRQQELEAKRKAADEQRRRQLEQRRQQQEQERQRLLQEKERMRTGKPGSAAARPSTPPAAAAAAGPPGRGPSLAVGAGRPTSAGSKASGPSSQTAAGSLRVPAGSSNQRQRQQQQQKDPYAHLNPRQRAFLLARKREREGRMNGRSDYSRAGSVDVDELYEDEYDDLDDFICDDEEADWRAQLRAMTGYDPRKYQDSFWDDRKMEASAAEIAAEERRSARMGRAEDEREAEAEARRLAAKEAKKSGRKKGAAALFDD